MKQNLRDVIENQLTYFCKEFLENPYLCYTEHGLHAYFYYKLMSALSDLNYPTEFAWKNKKIAVVQKEYPTYRDLGDSRRQHWDISVIDNKDAIKCNCYDEFKLFCAIEFGMNESRDHLENDCRRLADPNANLANKYIVHLYRISGVGEQRISRRDLSINTRREILSPMSIQEILQNNQNNKSIKIFYALYNDVANTQDTISIITDIDIKAV